MRKIFNDTLKSPNGKYSRKSITILVSLSAGFFYEFIMPFLIHWFDVEHYEHRPYVFKSLLAFTELLLFATVYDKHKLKKIDDN